MQNIGSAYSEKRDYPRMKVEADMTYTMTDGDNQYKAFCKNLSHSGILFTTEGNLTPGDSVLVTLGNNKKAFSPMQAKVEVIRVMPSDREYSIAGKIIEYQ